MQAAQRRTAGLKKPLHTEHEIQAGFFTVLKAASEQAPALDLVFAIPNGGVRDIKTARALKAEGVKAGVWDVFIPIPIEAPDGDRPGAWIEFKRKGNGLSDSQIAFRDALLPPGYQFAVCYDIVSALTFVSEYLGIRWLKPDLLEGDIYRLRPPKVTAIAFENKGIAPKSVSSL